MSSITDILYGLLLFSDDHSRVELDQDNDEIPTDDYINGNYIDVSNVFYNLKLNVFTHNLLSWPYVIKTYFSFQKLLISSATNSYAIEI